MRGKALWTAQSKEVKALWSIASKLQLLCRAQEVTARESAKYMSFIASNLNLVMEGKWYSHGQPNSTNLISCDGALLGEN